MKITRFLILFSLLMLAVNACGPEAATPTTDAASLEAVYTAAAQTVVAQAAAATATPTLKPSATPLPLASPTLVPTTGSAQSYTMPVAVVSSGTTCDNSAYVSDVTIPDGTIFAPGEAFTKTWKLANSGTCAWSTSYSLALVSGNALSGSTTALSAAVSSGEATTVSVAMVAPTTAGTYTSYWKLKNAAGVSFGEAVYVQIVVSSSAATVTATPTATDTTAATSTPTATDTTSATSTPTVTTAPTATTEPSATPLPTNTPEPTATETPVSA